MRICNFRVIYPVVAVFLLSACAATQTATKRASADTDSTSLTSLEQRALQRWQHLIDGQDLAAYEFLTPGYRATRSPESYIRGLRSPVITWESITWNGSDCDDENSCEVKLVLGYEARMPQAGNVFAVSPLTERWLRLDGVWYHLPGQ